MKAARDVLAAALLCMGVSSVSGGAPGAPGVTPAGEVRARTVGVQGAAVIVDLDRGALESALRGERAGMVRVREVPLGADRLVDLEVESFSVTSPRTRFVRGPGDRPLEGFDPSSVTLVRGNVAGEAGSHVFLALSSHGSAGLIDLGAGGRQFLVRSVNDGAAPPGLRLAIAESAAGPGPLLGVPVCGLQAAPGINPVPVSAIAGATGTTRSIEIAIETDYEYFSLFGDAPAAAAYVVQLYGAVSDIYLRDANAHVEVVFVRLWDTPADLFDDPDPLGPFSDYWALNMTGVQRDVAQFLTGRRNLPYGGVAYLEALCTDFAYSVTGYILGSFSDPDLPAGTTWDVIVTAHELGHNCGTLHTHDYGIDACASGELQRGTIMSYCHTLPGGNGNIDLYFHEGTSSVMRSFMAGAECLAHDCNGNGIDDATDIGGGGSADADADGVPDECQDCNGNGTLDGADISGGGSSDLNGNGIPDECEPDCNGNGVPDDRDILLGDSLDAHGDGVPDECDADCNANATSDYSEIQLDMTLDVDRSATLDACQDCDGDGTTDMAELAGAHNLWVASQVSNSMSQMHAGSGVLVLTSAGGSLSAPQYLLVRADGRVLVSSGNRVAQYNANGTFAGDFVTAGSGTLNGAAGLGFRSGGTLLVASSGNNRVLEYNGTTGAFVGTFVTAGLGGLTGPRALRFGPDGNLYVSTSNNRVLKYDGADGAFIGTFVAPSSGGLSGARGLVFKPDGNLLVASSTTSQILEYDGRTGASLGQWNHGGLTSGFWALASPWALEIGPNGNIYATSNSGNAAVHMYDVDNGSFMRSFYVLASAGPVSQPTGLGFVPGDAVDCNLNLVPDSCDIGSGVSLDGNNNGVPDECEGIPGDLDGDGSVGIGDFLQLLGDWGPCPQPCPPACAADLDGDCSVGVIDFLILLGNW